MNCCVTGHRPKGFPFPHEHTCAAYAEYMENLDRTIQNFINAGHTHFITGMAEGADLDFAHCVLSHRSHNRDITLEAALPYPIRSVKQASIYHQERTAILSQCDRVFEVSSHYYNGCMQKRNIYMVDHSDLVLAVWNGIEKGGTWNTIQYALKQGKPIHYIRLDT